MASSGGNSSLSSQDMMTKTSFYINDSNQVERKAHSFSTWVVSDHDQMNIQNCFQFPNFNSSSSLLISTSQASSPSSYNFSPAVLFDSSLSFSNYDMFSSTTVGTFPGAVSNNVDSKHLDFSFHSQAWPCTGPSFENNSSGELFSGQQGIWTSNTPRKQAVVPTAFLGVKPEGVSTGNVSRKIASAQTNVQNSYPLHSNQAHCTQSIPEQRRSEDGHSWRKYRDKQMKANHENPRSYYKCTSPNCSTKKMVETNLDGEITEIVYKRSHNHPKPQPTRRSSLQSFQNPLFTSSEISIQSNYLFNNSSGDSAEIPKNCSTSFGDKDFDQVSPVSISRDDDTNELEAKRWKSENEFEGSSASSSASVEEPRIVIQTTSDTDILDDGYRWRKYGQKVVKGNPNPRSYYKCTFTGCPVRKHIERASNDLRSVITTYEGRHNHDVPAARGSGSCRPSSVDSKNNVPPVIRPLVINRPSNPETNYPNFLQSMGLPTTSSQYTLQMLQNRESLRLSDFAS